MKSGLKIRVLSGFDDSACGPDVWNRRLAIGNTNEVFLTYQWQRAWWESFGRGQLLLIAVESKNGLVALAPFFADGGMVFFVGSGGSDYLDFIGDIGEPEVLDALLTTARDCVSDFVGFRFYLVPDTSLTGQRLQNSATHLGLTCFDEGALPAPALDFRKQPELARAASEKKSLLRHERFFRREGQLEVRHFYKGEDIRPHLEEFFAQHIARWEVTPHPSLFLDAEQRAFYIRLTQGMGDTGWLRFTRVNWNNRPIAFHFGFCYNGSYLWYKPSFALDLARHSPGEVLLRQLLLAARDEGAHTFDFGIGDEPFKRRFATRANQARTWGLYPAQHENSGEDKP